MSRSLLTSTPMSMALSAEDGEDAHTRQKRRRMEGAESVGGVVDAVAVASAAPPPPLPPPPPLLSRVGLRERHRSLAVRAERGLWRSFPTQAEALAFLQQAEGEDAEAAAVVGGAALRLWSVEYPPRMQWEVSGGGAAGSASGARRFVVSSYTTFYARYMTTPARERHHYEVIREGRPCHLYFDVDCRLAINPALATEERQEDVIRALISRVLCGVRSVYGRRVSVEDVVVMDSSTPSKLSRHIVMRIPDATFQDNQHMGGFVRHLCHCWMMEDERSGAGGPLPMSVFSSDPSTSPPPRRAPLIDLIDLGVYSRNRSFRLLWSSKSKANAPILHIHHSSAYAHAHSHQATFTHSTTQFHTHTAAPLTLLTWPPSGAGEAVVPAPSLFPHRPPLAAAPSWPSARCVAPLASSAPTPPLLHCGCSSARPPSPLCDSSSQVLARWIEATYPADPLPAVVRRWSLLSTAQPHSAHPQPCTGSRWCGRVQRAHRSNAVYLLLHLRTATQPPPPAAEAATASSASISASLSIHYTQRCHDPDCKGFTCAPIDAPQQLTCTIQQHQHRHSHPPSPPSPHQRQHSQHPSVTQSAEEVPRNVERSCSATDASTPSGAEARLQRSLGTESSAKDLALESG